MRQHLVVPFLVPQPLAGTQPIDGNPETEPRKIGTAMEHVTNIYRMQALADKHPEVSPHLRGCHNMGSGTRAIINFGQKVGTPPSLGSQAPPLYGTPDPPILWHTLFGILS